jgi:DNA-binding NtrC family response regulator
VANGGTIFLDEIGEVSQATQVKLLRVLDTSTFRHVGGTTEIKVDARVVVATNRALATLARQKLFREDLYYRLSTITVELSPLRQRAGDVELLAEHFVARLNERYGFYRRLGSEAMALLRGYDFPGNVRELLHVVESAAVVCEGSEILPHHLPAALRAPVTPSPPRADSAEPLPTLQEVERAHIERALRAAGGHRGNAARMLGISERGLYRKLEEYRLS